MLRTLVIAACIAMLHAIPSSLYSQCLIPPPLDSCDGSEPSLADNETLGVGIKKWFYAGTATYNSVTLRGGTLVVCGNLTFNNFSMDSGTVVVRPGAQLHIGGGAGVILRGNSAIYNYGLFECTANLSLDPTWATPAKPNVVINATATAFFKMSNQYFVINNANSYFVNRGRAEFWGLITDFGAGSGSVCLGRFSEVRMAVLYNNRRHTYIAPEGAACVNVFQYSQFRDTLTQSMNVNVCLGGSHSSDACGACRPNAWGTPNVFQFCAACNTIALLKKQDKQRPADPKPEEIVLSPNPFSGELKLQWSGPAPDAVEVHNLAGVRLFQKRLDAFNTHSASIQLPQSIPAGRYFIKIIFGKKLVVRQAVKID